MSKFEEFYANGAWDQMLENIIVPQEDMPRAEGMQVSWDQRAAYIAFKLLEKIRGTLS